ncbi:hypothetical protein ABZ079_21560 [Streptomyces sp. NPDC006314]|uniref:hypothetical protein n=1 Tax=Streptomyces sp. NPDC006314 TaxID=3154475 RepID=UPI0033BCC957
MGLRIRRAVQARRGHGPPPPPDGGGVSLTPVLDETGDEIAAGGLGALLRWK